MKKITFFIIVLCTIKIRAQDTLIKNNSNDSEAIGVMQKIKKVRTKGEELAAHSFTDITTHVSLVSNIPAGILQWVMFYFNSGLINLNKKAFAVDYKDTTLALVVYEMAADGKPGRMLTGTPLPFVIKKDHKGALDIDVSSLHLQSRPRLFIGITTINELKSNQVVLKTRANKTAVSYVIKKNSTIWEEYNDGSTPQKYDINMVVGVKGD